MLPMLLAALLASPQQLPKGVTDENQLGRPPLRQRSGAPNARPDTGARRKGTAPPPSHADGDDVQVNSASGADQDETPIRVDPSDRLHLVGACNDARSGSWNATFFPTFDGGLTWGETFFTDPGGFGNAGDPAVAIGPNGETYLLALAFSVDSSIYVGPSPDGGVTVPNWVQVVAASSNFEDKPCMICDTTGGPLSGAVYVTWTRFKSSGGAPIYMTASFDQGQTWSSPTRLSDSNSTQGSCPAVGPNGEVDVAFYDFTDSSIKFDTSPDGGVTWGKDVKIAPAAFLWSVPNTPFRTNSFPSIDVDTSGGPYQGTIYVVWATDQGNGNGPDVLLSKSGDGGATWSTPIVASDVATNSQFSPWVDVDVNGNVNVGFYDRRNDANDTKMRYYVSRSSDGGNTFLPNVRVSDKTFNPNKYNQGGFLGDYTGLAASDRTIHPIWTDGRNGDNDVYTSRVQLDLFTDLDTLSASTGGTVNFTLDPGPLYQNADYRILGSASGTSPGITLHGVNVPVNYDALMMLTILDANSSALPGFAGTLDGNGMAAASLVSGPIDPALIGVELDFAAFVKSNGAVRWASNPTHLVIGS
jgi:hypothetical protein